MEVVLMKSKENINILFKQGDSDERILKSMDSDEFHQYNSEELSKAMNRSGLVQKEVQVKGKNGQTFTRKQWVKASEDQPAPKQPKAQDTQKIDKLLSKFENSIDSYKKKYDEDSYVDAWYEDSYDKVEEMYNNDKITMDESSEIKRKLVTKSKELKSNKKDDKKQLSNQNHWTKVGTSEQAKSQIAQMLASGKSREDCMSDFKAQGVTWKESDNAGINWMRAAMAMNKHLTSKSNNIDVNKPNDSITNTANDSTDKATEEISESSQSNTPSAQEIQSIADNIKRTTIKIREANSAYFTSGYTDQNAKDRQDKADEESKKYTEKLRAMIDNMPDGTKLTYTYVNDDGTTEKKVVTFDTVTLQHKDPRYNGKTTKQMTIKWKDKNGKNHTRKVQKMFEAGYSVGIEHDFSGRGGSGKVTDISVNYPNNSSAQSKISESKKTRKSVIGSDYTQLATGKESGTIEGEAHNMMVGELGSEGKNKPTEFVVKATATYLKVNAIKTVISSYNQDELVHQLALAKQFTKFAGGNMDHMTLENIYKDVVSGQGSYTQEQKCNALAKLCGKDYTSFDDDVRRYASNSLANVSITPKSKGYFDVKFSYDDGESSTERFDSVKSAKEAADKFIDKEEKHAEKENSSDSMITDFEASDLDEADPYSQIVPENGMKPFVKTKQGWVSPDWKKPLNSQEMINLVDNIGGYLDNRGNGDKNVKPKSSKYDTNDPSLTNGL